MIKHVVSEPGDNKVFFRNIAEPFSKPILGLLLCSGSKIIPHLLKHVDEGGHIICKTTGQSIRNQVDGKNKISQCRYNHKSVFHRQFRV